jgi:hypothetical protein
MSGCSTTDMSCTQSFKIKYKTEVYFYSLTYSLRCAEIGNKQVNASLEKHALLHMETTNYRRRNMFLPSIKLSYASNITKLCTALMD